MAKILKKFFKVIGRWSRNFLFAIYLLTVFLSFCDYFKDEQPSHIYFNILCAFNKLYVIPYYLNTLALIFDILALIPFYGYLHNKKYFSPLTNQLFFIARVLIIFPGHTYELIEITSLFYTSTTAAISILGTFILIYIPSYLTHFISAFSIKWTKGRTEGKSR